jgi:hypothetical protein
MWQRRWIADALVRGSNDRISIFCWYVVDSSTRILPIYSSLMHVVCTRSSLQKTVRREINTRGNLLERENKRFTATGHRPGASGSSSNRMALAGGPEKYLVLV